MWSAKRAPVSQIIVLQSKNQACPPLEYSVADTLPKYLECVLAKNLPLLGCTSFTTGVYNINSSINFIYILAHSMPVLTAAPRSWIDEKTCLPSDWSAHFYIRPSNLTDDGGSSK